MRFEVIEIIEKAINDKSIMLDLSALNLRDIELPVEELSRISFVNLDDNFLNSIPKDLYRMELTSLSISNNEIGELSDDFNSLSHLNFLYLNGNKLKRLPKSFAELEFLTILNLSDNQFVKFPRVISKLKNLEDLYISRNRLHIFPKNFFNKKMQIETLDISENEFKSIPNEIEHFSEMTKLLASRNNISKLPPNIGLNYSLKELNISENKLTDIPLSLCYLPRLETLSLSYNKLIDIPSEISKLVNLENLDISNNEISDLPNNIQLLPKLKTLNIRNNKIEEFSKELKGLERSDLILDYRDNPFLERAFFRSQSFTKIWQGVPIQLREILKIYFSGFNTFYYQRTQKVITLNVNNESDGLVFEVIPDENIDPELVDKLLKEFFDILKTKIHEGAETGMVYPSPTGDPAIIFAQTLATNFTQNASLVRFSTEKYISNQDILAGIYGAINEMESGLDQLMQISQKLTLEVQQQKQKFARLEGKSEAQQEEIIRRQQESILAITKPIHVITNVTTNVIIKQQIGNDFSNLREVVDPYLKEFQRREGADLQKEIDSASQKPELKNEEKNTLGKRIGRWIENTKGAVKMAKDAGEVIPEVVKYYDKIKDFAEGVLNNPELAESIKQIMDNFMRP
ncbi:leucine-rich repeat domain-containing protein [Spirosoma foliorum]|uniref:Leucine-rich repeat domain-containing protein n=1 Tax=Spirosoma foliorum TaxID=2710596 RepID=A0A7G5H3H6_9BACT|nr:leucine-rich repeat domain-containing protein [Spirosoma foliorum]QMW05668.1 leucine-rich repeat domain-containing protein [Spirosoma foliorum]